MIHALIADSHGRQATRSFIDMEALTRWNAVQKRQRSGLTLAASTLTETPTLFELEARAREYVVRVTQCPKGFQWASKNDGAGYFPTRPQALRDAFECGELGE